MRGDFSRHTFVPEKRYSAVLVQQGRLHVDADLNEQQEIAAHRTRTADGDALGACATPLEPPEFATAPGFRIAVSADRRSFTIGEGRCYVDGMLCENGRTIEY